MVVAGASPTGNGFYNLDLFAATGVLDKVPDVDDALETGVWCFLSRWVRGCARLFADHGDHTSVVKAFGVLVWRRTPEAVYVVKIV